jgi:predicted nucleotidyltransferase
MLVAALGIFHANVRRAAQAVVILTKGKMNTDSNDLQQNIIRKLTTLLKKENIVAALFLKGSIARGTADRYSDIDYYCLIHKNSMQEIMDKRKKLVTSIGKIIYLEEVNFGNPQLIVIYDNEVHLDLYIIDEMPSSGTDAIQVLHDPMGITTSYQRVDLFISNSDIIEYINETLYHIHELEIASHRKDRIWEHRIRSHMISYIALLTSIKNCTGLPVLHLKKLYDRLTHSDQNKIASLIKASNKEEISEFIIQTLEIVHKEILENNLSRNSQIKWDFIHHIEKKYKEYRSITSTST